MSEILQAGMSHLVSQKRILKTSLKILNTKNFTKLIQKTNPLTYYDLMEQKLSI